MTRDDGDDQRSLRMTEKTSDKWGLLVMTRDDWNDQRLLGMTEMTRDDWG